jgi:acetyl esterase/lipase
MPGLISHWRVLVLVVVLGLAPAARGYQVIADITYSSPGSTRNKLDIIMPLSGPTPGLPTIVYIHGGAWHTRDKGDDLPLYIELTNHGYAVVACNYTLASSGNPSFPQAVRDVKNVIRWVRIHGGQHGLSPVIITAGPSAGGHLAMMAAMTAGNAQFETLSRPLGGYRPSAFISIAGFTDLEMHVLMYGQEPMFHRFLGAWYDEQTAPLYRAASPAFHVTNCDPPGGMVHGTADTVVPPSHAVLMAQTMQTHGIFATVELVNGAGHSFDPMGGHVGVAQRIAALAPLLMQHSPTADLNGSGALNIEDFIEMISLFAIEDPRADINMDGNLNIEDFISFITLFAQGC